MFSLCLFFSLSLCRSIFQKISQPNKEKTKRMQKSDKIIQPQHCVTFNRKFIKVFLLIVGFLIFIMMLNFLATVNVIFLFFLTFVQVHLNWFVKFFVHLILLEIDLFGEVFHDNIKFVKVWVDEKNVFINGIDSERLLMFLSDKF